MTFLQIVLVIVVGIIIIYIVARIATRGALTEIEEFFKSKKDGSTSDRT